MDVHEQQLDHNCGQVNEDPMATRTDPNPHHNCGEGPEDPKDKWTDRERIMAGVSLDPPHNCGEGFQCGDRISRETDRNLAKEPGNLVDLGETSAYTLEGD